MKDFSDSAGTTFWTQYRYKCSQHTIQYDAKGVFDNVRRNIFFLHALSHIVWFVVTILCLTIFIPVQPCQ